MSDIVDDLHYAEEMMGVYRHTLEYFLKAYKRAVEAGTLAVEGFATAGIEAERRLDETYCRPSCGGSDYEPHEDGFGTVYIYGCTNDCCGCPCHRDQEWNDNTNQWEDTDEPDE